jgi:outer membrane protein TolC
MKCVSLSVLLGLGAPVVAQQMSYALSPVRTRLADEAPSAHARSAQSAASVQQASDEILQWAGAGAETRSVSVAGASVPDSVPASATPAAVQSAFKAVAVPVDSAGAQTLSLDALVALALRNNPTLAGQQQAVVAGLEQVKQVAANRYPTVGLNARATVAEGGRSFDIPTGDALNPVYRNLEVLNQRNGVPAGPYPTLQNQRLSLLRPHEQDTRVVVTAPLYAPALQSQIQAAGASAIAVSAKLESDARHLVRDVKVAYQGIAQALAQKQVLSASSVLLAENLRVNEVLFAEGKITRDAVLRAQAELLNVRQAVAEAQFTADQAARRLNVLTQRPLDTEVFMPAQVSPKTDALHMDGFQVPPELRQILAGIEARKSLETAARKSFLPTVGFAAEAGYQGSNYSTGPNTGVALASIVLNWKFSDGGARDAQVGAALAQRRQLELQEDDARRQLEQVLRGSADRYRLSLSQLQSSQSRQRASEEAFRIASRKRESGNLSQLEFFDAERALTDSRQAAVAAAAQVNVAAAEFELAKSSFPLPAHLQQMNPEAIKP